MSNMHTKEDLKQKYRLRTKQLRIPGTFTRTNPSWLIADIAWILLALYAALVMGGTILSSRRSHFAVSIGGDKDTVDFSYIKAEDLVQYLSEHLDTVQETLDAGNLRIHYLSRLIDPCPSFIAKPSRSTSLSSLLLSFGCLIRFWFLHKNWRYNTTILLGSYLLWIGTYSWSPLDRELSMWTSLFMAFPFICASSVILHRLLGKNAWKPHTLVLEAREDGHEQDTEALLYEGELKKRDEA